MILKFGELLMALIVFVRRKREAMATNQARSRVRIGPECCGKQRAVLA